jgi:hypothetical protein
MTSDSARSEGTRDAGGTPSVLTRLPSACVTRVYSAWPLSVKPRWSHTDWTPARQWGQVLSQWQKGTTTKSPGPNAVTAAPTSSTIPTASCPIVSPASTGFSPR